MSENWPFFVWVAGYPFAVVAVYFAREEGARAEAEQGARKWAADLRSNAPVPEEGL